VLKKTIKNCKKRKVEVTESTRQAIDAAADLFFRYDDNSEEYNIDSFLEGSEVRGLITPVVAAWNRSLYELWWKPRTSKNS
jgi:hypothetical protein